MKQAFHSILFFYLCSIKKIENNILKNKNMEVGIYYNADLFSSVSNLQTASLLRFMLAQNSHFSMTKEYLANVMQLNPSMPLMSLKKRAEISVKEINELHKKGLLSFCVALEYKTSDDPELPFTFLMKGTYKVIEATLETLPIDLSSTDKGI